MEIPDWLAQANNKKEPEPESYTCCVCHTTKKAGEIQLCAQCNEYFCCDWQTAYPTLSGKEFDDSWSFRDYCFCMRCGDLLSRSELRDPPFIYHCYECKVQKKSENLLFCGYCGITVCESCWVRNISYSCNLFEESQL